MLKLRSSILFQINTLLGVFILSGCATVTRSPYERFIVETKPDGAQVELSTGEICITPCNLLKRRNESFNGKVKKKGYEPVEVKIESKVAGGGAAGFVGNAVVGGVIGAGVDVYSGATLGLVPNPLVIELKKIQTNRVYQTELYRVHVKE